MREFAEWTPEDPKVRWLPERSAVVSRAADGRVVAMRVGSSQLEGGDWIQVHRDGSWVDCVVQWRGDGQRPLREPFLMAVEVSQRQGRDYISRQRGPVVLAGGAIDGARIRVRDNT